jgi:hypothetical protein
MPFLQEDLKTAIGAVASGRVYIGQALDGVSKPYVVFFRVTNVPSNTLNSGAPLSNTIFQIDCYDKTYAGANSVKEAVKAALTAWAVKNLVLSEQDVYEADVKLHRITLDVSVWS